MAPKVAEDRYPKRKRAEVNYEIDLSIDGDLDLEDDRNVSEELGEDSPASADSIKAHQPAVADIEVDSEFEDATFGSRKIKKRKVLVKPKSKSHTKVKPPPKFKPFRLMDLPPELRMKVYEEALVDPHGVNIRTFSDKYESFPIHVCINNVKRRFGPSPNPKCYVRGEWTQIEDNAAVPKKKYQLSPNLLAACKTVHDEAVSLFWTQPFIFGDPQGLHSFLLMLRPETISRLRDITLLFFGWINNRCLQTFVLLRDAPLLQNLRLDCTVRPNIRLRSGVSKEVAIGQQLATKIYRDCYPFLKAIVNQQGAESILNILKFSREEFKNSYFNPSTGKWDEDDWSQARQDKILEAMLAEINTIMSRKVVPKFPRSRY